MFAAFSRFYGRYGHKMLLTPWLLVVTFLAFVPSVVFAWSATGHHVIASFAFDQLDESEQIEVMRTLAAHPDFSKHFNAPKGVSDSRSIDRWQIGVAGCWPDIIRGSDQDRPTWHYELAGTATIGDVKPPNEPGDLPDDATMGAQGLYIGQAFQLCRKVYKDNSRQDSERAIALCWLCHIVADGHQPLHAGSIYVAGVFPEGDRGGNSIRMGRGNLHSTWDGLLGGTASPSDVQRRVAELKADTLIVDRVLAHREAFRQGGDDSWVKPPLWLRESRSAARQHAYTPEVLGPVTAAMRGLTNRVELPKLSDEYYLNAGKIARIRATQAGYRLATLLSKSFSDQ